VCGYFTCTCTKRRITAHSILSIIGYNVIIVVGGICAVRFCFAVVMVDFAKWQEEAMILFE
jgi:hypothetical protein